MALESEHRERHLLGGLGLQIFMVGFGVLLVFAYTQAIRQAKREGDLRARFQEQLTIAREELGKQPSRSMELAHLQAQVESLRARLLAFDAVAGRAEQIRQIAGAEFGIDAVRVEVSESPVETWDLPMPGGTALQIQLYSLELEGAGTSREIAGLLERLKGSAAEPAPFQAMTILELKASEGTGPEKPAHLFLRWLIPATVPSENPEPSGAAVSSDGKPAVVSPPPGSGPDAASRWGWRSEPFLSPWVSLEAVRLPPEKRDRFHLTGITADPSGSVGVINGTVLKAGDRFGEYEVEWIGPTGILLQGTEEEIWLSYP